MPRKPTGRGRGRPPGSGHLGEEGTGHKRLTVRLPTALYDALEALAEKEHYTREAPELARTVRTALEHYLACQHRRQTDIVPSARIDNKRQTGILQEKLEDNTGQTTIVQEPLGDTRGQTENVQEPQRSAGGRDKKRQTEKVTAMSENKKRQTTIQPQEEAPRRPGRQSTLRPPIVALVRQHPEGLTAVEIKVHLHVDKNIGDVLQGMVRNQLLTKQGSGAQVRYRAASPAYAALDGGNSLVTEAGTAD